MINIFNPTGTEHFVSRIKQLTPDTKANWGKMSVSQMLAHCNVSYEMVYDDIHQKPKGLLKFILKTFVKNKVVTELPYPKHNRTAPQFIIKDERNFDIEKERLVGYINKTQELGEAHFNGKESHSFGNLSTKEWNNMFAKHLDHHLNQFGV